MSDRKFVNRCWNVVSNNPGAGNVTLGVSVVADVFGRKSTFLSIADQLSSGDTFTYEITEDERWEIGEATFTGPGTVSRDVVFINSEGTTAKLVFTANALIANVISASDVNRLREFKFLADFKLPAETTYDNAFVRARTYFESNYGGVLLLPAGQAVEVTARVDYTDLTQPIIVHGHGQQLSLIYGNFTGAGDAVIDLSFTDNANRINGVGARGFMVCANGVLGDPIGIKALRAQQQLFRDLWFPGDGDILMGGTRALANTGLMITQVNNSDVQTCTFKCGWHTVGFDVGTAVRFNVDISDNTCTADTPNTFTEDMVGAVIIFSEGQAGDNVGFFWTTIASFTDDQEVELTDAPATAITDAEASIGFLTGSVTAANATLTLDQDLTEATGLSLAALQAGLPGMRVHIPYGHVKADAGNTDGLLCTYVASVTDETHIELGGTPDNNAANVPIIFAPGMFVGHTFEEEGEGRQTNDFTITDCQFEACQGAGLIANLIFEMRIDKTKIEMEGFGGAQINKAGRSVFPMLLSEVKALTFMDGAINYGMHPTYGQVWVLGSRGFLRLENTTHYGLIKDQPMLYIDDEVTDDFHASIGPGSLAAGIAKQDADYQFVRIPTLRPRSLEYIGPYHDRHGNKTIGAKRRHIGYLASRYYGGDITPLAPSAAQTADRTYVHPFEIKGPRARVVGLACVVNNAVVSTDARLAIYENVIGKITGESRPGRLIAQGATEIDGNSATAQDSDFASPVWLEEGIYWVAALINGAAEIRSLDVARNRWVTDILGGSLAQASSLTAPIVGFTTPTTYSNGIDDDLTGATFTGVTTSTCPHILIKT